MRTILNLQLNGEFLQELHKTYHYLRVVPDVQDGKPILQASKKLKVRHCSPDSKSFYMEGPDEKWDTIPVPELMRNARTIVQIYPNRIWDIEELL